MLGSPSYGADERTHREIDIIIKLQKPVLHLNLTDHGPEPRMMLCVVDARPWKQSRQLAVPAGLLDDISRLLRLLDTPGIGFLDQAAMRSEEQDDKVFGEAFVDDDNVHSALATAVDTEQSMHHSHNPSPAYESFCPQSAVSPASSLELAMVEVPVVERSVNAPLKPYRIEVQTSSVRGSGTDSAVFLTIVGSHRRTAEVQLSRSKLHRLKLSRGQIDVFELLVSSTCQTAHGA